MSKTQSGILLTIGLTVGLISGGLAGGSIVGVVGVLLGATAFFVGALLFSRGEARK